MPETTRRLTWVRAVDRYPDLEDDLDHFIALDGEVEVGVVKLMPAPAGEEWMWSMWLTHPGPAFKRPTNGRTPTRGKRRGSCSNAGRRSGSCLGSRTEGRGMSPRWTVTPSGTGRRRRNSLRLACLPWSTTCREGIVSKRKGSPYISGPTTTWRKVKCPDYVRAGEGT